ncbi:MAG: 2-amino-4-hydroxy-6-hydroxymethyldihydropteridine diphosphokinase [Roseovarius sp.]
MTWDQLCLIAIGANVASRKGCPARTVGAALQHLDGGPGRVAAASRLYRTPAFPPGAGPDFVNAAAALWLPGDAASILARLHEIEADFGRARTVRWGQRTLDLDLIAIGDAVLPDPDTFRQWQGLDPAAQRQQTPEQLILPHPRMQDRAFVLVPLAEIMSGIAPDWRHPVLGRSVQEMLEALPHAEIDAVRPI